MDSLTPLQQRVRRRSIFRCINSPVRRFSIRIKSLRNKPAPSGRVFGYGRLEAQIHFGGEGDQQIITALLPRPVGVGTDGGLRDVKQITSGDKGVGFVAMASDGSEIKYLASTLAEGDDLVLDSLDARAGLLAVNGGHGFVLDCKSLSMGGAAIPDSIEGF